MPRKKKNGGEEMSKLTQGERILAYCRLFGSITPMDAFNDLGITKLATRISELMREGEKIYKRYDHSTNRFGEKTYFMRYALHPFEESNDGSANDKPIRVHNFSESDSF